jgi:hypothetical protein
LGNVSPSGRTVDDADSDDSGTGIEVVSGAKLLVVVTRAKWLELMEVESFTMASMAANTGLVLLDWLGSTETWNLVGVEILDLLPTVGEFGSTGTDVGVVEVE